MVRTLFWCLVVAGTSLIGGPTNASVENIEITISSEIVPVFQNGELSGCALNFAAGKNDQTYFKGDLAILACVLWTAPRLRLPIACA